MSAFRIQIDLPAPHEGKSAWLTMISPGTDDLETARELAEGYFLPHRVRDVQWMTEEGQDDDA